MNPAAPPHLSLVIPAFDEEQRIEASLQRIGAFLSSLDFACEVVLVDDGSKPAGRAACERAIASLPPSIGRSLLRVEKNRGKGAAVRDGCLAAAGDYVAYIDADLASPPEDLVALMAALDDGADVAVGVRNQLDGSDMRDARPPLRRLAGRVYALAMSLVLLPGVGDSQCPLKTFRRDAAQRLFRLQRIQTWSFDAELLFLADRLGLRVARAPVRWQDVAGSHLRLNARNALELLNLLRIRWLHRNVSKSTLAVAEAPAIR
jgi:dolichyl-phosphate beta-glucosyltransferase